MSYDFQTNFSQFYENITGYLGINLHYLRDWTREILCLACIPFDESHTAVNIYGRLKSVLDEWDIFHKTGPSLRDNAANMIGGFY